MIEFDPSYESPHTGIARDMLQRAEELSLFVAPETILRVSLDTDTIEEASFDGQSLETYDRDTEEGVLAAQAITLGKSQLEGLATRSSMSLVASEMARDEEQPLKEVAGRAWGYSRGEHAIYATYGFRDEMERFVHVTTARIEGPDGEARARSLRVEIKEGGLMRALVIEELPRSFDGAAQLSIEETISPAHDEKVQAAIDLVGGSAEDMKLIERCFTALFEGGRATAEEEKLLAKYTKEGKGPEIMAVLQDVRKTAEAERASAALIREHPELALPSTEQLFKYADALKP